MRARQHTAESLMWRLFQSNNNWSMEFALPAKATDLCPRGPHPWWGRPLVPEIFGQPTPFYRKRRFSVNFRS